MNEMQVFKYQETDVRTVEKDGEVWWVLADVCKVLELREPHRVAHRLDDDEKGRTQMTTLGGNQQMTIISESGLYKVILRSDKPEAKKFTRWVTHEVLPTIRRTGGYGQKSAQGFSLEQVTEIAAAVASQVAMQIIPIIVAAVRQGDQEHRRSETVKTKPSPVVEGGYYGPARCKMETFPPEVLEQVDGMLSDMLQQQALNFSMIARYCTINGYTISSPAVKTYYQKHFNS